MNLTFARRIGVLLISGALATTTLVGATAPAHAAGDDTGARWLTRQLDAGLVHNDQFDFDDYGLTADIGLALVEIGGKPEAVKDIKRALARKVKSWTTGADFDSSDVYAGSTAKALVFALAAKKNPRSFGGVDLVKQLSGLISKTGPTVGRIQDKSATDYANTIGQALAVRGLAAAGSGQVGKARRFLLMQQCGAGFFRLNFAPAKTGPQGCDAGSKAESAPDTDATAVAVLALQSLDKKSRTVRAAIADGIAWLKREQKKNGSFGGGPSTKGSNANSTGLAASALAGSGQCLRAQRAARWIGKLQLTSGAEKGAIAYNRGAFQAAQGSGIGVEQADQWRRATSQAAPALAFASTKACRS